VDVSPTQEPKIVKSKEEVIALGPEWSPTPIKPRIDMTGKSLPTKSDTQRLTEAVAWRPDGQETDADPASIAAIVAAVMTAMQPMLQAQQPKLKPMPAESSIRCSRARGDAQARRRAGRQDRQALEQ
jgi:hypothetical protein